ELPQLPLEVKRATVAVEERGRGHLPLPELRPQNLGRRGGAPRPATAHVQATVRVTAVAEASRQVRAASDASEQARAWRGGLEQCRRCSDRLGLAQQEEAARLQREVEGPQHALLQFRL